MQSYKSWCNCTFCSGLAQVSRVVEKEEARKEIQEQLEDLAMIEEAEYLFDGTLVPLDEVLVDIEEEEQHDCGERGCFEPGGTFYEPPNRKARKKLTKEKDNGV